MKKIITVIGARPQFIKAAIVSKALKKQPNLREIIVHTGQHYDKNMSSVFFEELDMPPIEYHLNIGSGTHGKQTGVMLIEIENILLQEKPDWLLIYGDTNSTLAGALAAAKCHIPIAHVEAGLRSYNDKMPEEINRVLADKLSAILFTPTINANENLKKEGFADKNIYLVGDVMYDAALFYAAQAPQRSVILKTLNLSHKDYILVTIHRAENTNDPKRLEAIFQALAKLANNYPIVLPLHPRTKKLWETNISPLIQVVEPLGFFDMITLEKNAKLIVTDSGGVQKEAFFYEVPCITLREETEWIETTTLGWNTLVPPWSHEVIETAIINSLDKFGEKNVFPYGKGNAANLITNFFYEDKISAHLDC